MIAVTIVILLPSSFNTVKTILISSNDDLKIEQVTSQVLCLEKDCMHELGATALVAKHGKHKGNGYKGRNPNTRRKGDKDAQKDDDKPKCAFCKK